MVSGALSISWRATATTIRARMLMYGREAQSKTRIASPATIPKSGERNRKIHSCIPTDKRIDILNALERIGFFPAYGGVRTMQQIMEKSVPGSGPQFYFVFRENELIGYNFLIGDTKKYKAFPWLAISNMDEQKLTVCEELMKIQIAFFEELGMQKIADHCVRIMEDYRKGIGKRKESDCR